jgi:Thiamine pyrophosphate enzyme, C-terminal TPP binding domain
MGAPGVTVIGWEWGPIMIDMHADIGAAIERGLDFLYLCYDNEEGHGNTGEQASASTPHGAHTTTTSDGNTGWKKDLFSIWIAHRPTYATTVIGVGAGANMHETGRSESAGLEAVELGVAAS